MTAERFELANSEVAIEETPAGEVARVERGDRVEWTKVLPDATLRALRKAANRGGPA